MWDPFSYSGPKSAERLEDERYVRALILRETRTLQAVADALGLHPAKLKSQLFRINRDADDYEQGIGRRGPGKPKSLERSR